MKSRRKRKALVMNRRYPAGRGRIPPSFPIDSHVPFAGPEVLRPMISFSSSRGRDATDVHTLREWEQEMV